MRLFFALIPSEGMIAAVRPLLSGVSSARWQTERQLHVTLRFVGEVSAQTADDLLCAMEHRIEDVPSGASLSGIGVFEHDRRPNALWVRVTPKEPLLGLHRKLDRMCQAAGLPPEGRTYLPHMTVARLPRRAGSITAWLETHAGFATERLPFARCSLMESIMTPDGSHYKELAGMALCHAD